MTTPCLPRDHVFSGGECVYCDTPLPTPHTLEDFSYQLAIWHACWWGVVVEKTAVVAELGERISGWRFGGWTYLEMWDRSLRSLADQEIRLPDGSRHSVPDWFALPWVAEHIYRYGRIDVEITAVLAR